MCVRVCDSVKQVCFFFMLQEGEEQSHLLLMYLRESDSHSLGQSTGLWNNNSFSLFPLSFSVIEMQTSTETEIFL